MKIFSLFFHFSLLLGITASNAQDFLPGNTYFSQDQYIEYQVGNLPIILSAPHGGLLKPLSLPDRNCNNCSYVADGNTQLLAREIAHFIELKTACKPHLIINHLHRIKLDANRNIIEATDSNSLVEPAWNSFHEFIDTAKQQITNKFLKGLFLDIHGHGHSIQRLELGYLLTNSELNLSDSTLDANYATETSIRNLAQENLGNLSFSELLRGKESFGTNIEDKGYSAVPSQNDPFPDNIEPYFSGGYNTFRHGSYNSGSIDAIQIECNSEVRFDSVSRKEFADSLASTIVDFISAHYLSSLPESWCSSINTVKNSTSALKVFPNPFSWTINISIANNNIPIDIKIFNASGQLVFNDGNFNDEYIDLSHLAPGFYFMHVASNTYHKIIPLIKI